MLNVSDLTRQVGARDRDVSEGRWHGGGHRECVRAARTAVRSARRVSAGDDQVSLSSPEDDAIMARFVSDYLGLLDERVATITKLLESGNDLTAHTCLLSLESTSSMVGAKELAGIAGLLRGAVERQQRHVVPALVQAMTTEAVKVHQELSRAG